MWCWLPGNHASSTNISNRPRRHGRRLLSGFGGRQKRHAGGYPKGVPQPGAEISSRFAPRRQNRQGKIPKSSGGVRCAERLEKTGTVRSLRQRVRIGGGGDGGRGRTAAGANLDHAGWAGVRRDRYQPTFRPRLRPTRGRRRQPVFRVVRQLPSRRIEQRQGAQIALCRPTRRRCAKRN